MGSFLPLSFLKSGEAAKTKKNVVVGCSPENVLSKWFLQGAICKHNPNILLSSFESAKNSPNSRLDIKDLNLSDCDVHVIFAKKIQTTKYYHSIIIYIRKITPLCCQAGVKKMNINQADDKTANGTTPKVGDLVIVSWSHNNRDQRQSVGWLQEGYKNHLLLHTNREVNSLFGDGGVLISRPLIDHIEIIISEKNK